MEEVMMPSTTEAIKDYQRRLARLASVHAKALKKLEAEQAIRAQLLTERDRRVEEAGIEVHRAIATMALEVGPELTASVLGLDPRVARRLARNESADSNLHSGGAKGTGHA
jgi:hypothetical protein